jgi:hypothetical protein
MTICTNCKVDPAYEFWQQERLNALDNLEMLWRMRKRFRHDAAPHLAREIAKIRRRLRTAENKVDAIHKRPYRFTHPVRGWSCEWSGPASFLRAWLDKVEAAAADFARPGIKTTHSCGAVH